MLNITGIKLKYSPTGALFEIQYSMSLDDESPVSNLITVPLTSKGISLLDVFWISNEVNLKLNKLNAHQAIQYQQIQSVGGFISY